MTVISDEFLKDVAEGRKFCDDIKLARWLLEAREVGRVLTQKLESALAAEKDLTRINAGLNEAIQALHDRDADMGRKLESAQAMVRLEHDGHADAVALLQQERDKHRVTLLQVDAKEAKLHRICQLIEGVPCSCRQLPNFQQCKRCRIIEILAGEPGSSFKRNCAHDHQLPVTVNMQRMMECVRCGRLVS